MSEPVVLFQNDGLILWSVKVCAEDPHILSIEGRVSSFRSESVRLLLKGKGWNVLRVGEQGSLIGFKPGGGLLILQPDGGVSLSRIEDIDAAQAFLIEVFNNPALERQTGNSTPS